MHKSRSVTNNAVDGINILNCEFEFQNVTHAHTVSNARYGQMI